MDAYEKMEELRDLLDEARAKEDRAGEVAALHAIGAFYFKEKVWEAAEDYWRQAAAVCRQNSRIRELAQVLKDLGDTARIQGDPGRAEACFVEALDLFKRLAVTQGQANILDRLGDLALARDAGPVALDYFQEGLGLCRAGEDRIGGLYFLEKLIQIYNAANRYEDTEKACRESITLAEQIGDRERMALGLVGLADVVRRLGRLGEGRPYLEMAHDLYLRLGRESEAGLIRSEIEKLFGTTDRVQSQD